MPRSLSHLGLASLSSRSAKARSVPLLAAAALAASLATPASGHGDPPSVSVALSLPPELRVGDRSELVAEVRLLPPSPHPVLVTPKSEGSALEVVRGRLLRADAEDPGAEVLRFRIPVVARAAGDAVLRVEVEGHACASRCIPTRGEARIVARVLRP